MPQRRGETYFFSKNDGLQNQSVYYIQRGLNGTPEVFIDPNQWSEDGTVRLTTFAPSRDGKLVAYGVSRSGSDWQEYRVMDVVDPQADERSRGMGQGLGRGVARQRVLLQPLSGAGEGQGAVVDQRGSPGLLPSPRHAAVGRRTGVPRSEEPAAVPHAEHHRGRTLRGARRLGSRHRQAGQRHLRAGSVQAGREVHAADSRHHRRHLQRARERPRRAAGVHRQGRAQRPRRPHRPREPGAGELEGDPRREDRHHRQHLGGRRQGDRHLHEGRGVEGLRAQHRRAARERDRSAGPRQRQRLQRPHGRREPVLHLFVVQLPVDDLPLRGRGAEELGVPRAGDSRASTSTSTRPSRCS